MKAPAVPPHPCPCPHPQESLQLAGTNLGLIHSQAGRAQPSPSHGQEPGAVGQKLPGSPPLGLDRLQPTWPGERRSGRKQEAREDRGSGQAQKYPSQANTNILSRAEADKQTIYHSPSSPSSLMRSRCCISAVSPCIRPGPPQPHAPSWDPGQEPPPALGWAPPAAAPCSLGGKRGGKSPVEPQDCSIHCSGTRVCSSLGQHGVVSVAAVARPALSPGQV